MKTTLFFCIGVLFFVGLKAFPDNKIRVTLEYTDKNNLLIKHTFNGNLTENFSESTDKGVFSIENFADKTQKRFLMSGAFTEEACWKKAEIIIPYSFSTTDLMYADGYQSWSASEEKPTGEKMVFPGFWVPKVLLNSGDYLFANVPPKKGLIHGWQYGYIRKNTNRIEFIGSLDEKEGFTQIVFDAVHQQIILRKDLEGAIRKKGEKTNVFSICMDEGEINPVFERYFAAGNKKEVPTNPKTGWCSWYQYYTNVSEKIVLENLNAMHSMKAPIDYIQIDDGWQGAIGDWLIVNDKFPSGLSALSKEIHQKGYQSGLWLAPFICEQKSEVFRNHPDWILKNAKGKKVKAGYNPGWSGNFYVLDIYHPEVKEYIREVFKKVVTEWDFDMVKLDFLYAVAILPQNGKSRGQVMTEAMEFLRECLGEKKILGCGVPMASLGNTVDFCRIGPDVGLIWNNNLLDKIANFRETISCKRSVINALSRYQTNGWRYLNDPDVYNLRGNDNRLTVEQKNLIFTINQISGGLILTSDNPNNYTPEEKKQFLSQFPVKGKTGIELQGFQVSASKVRNDKNTEWVLSSVTPNNTVQKDGVYGVVFQSGIHHYYYVFNLGKKNAKVRFPFNDYVWMHPDSGYPVIFQKDDFISLKPFQSVLLKWVSSDEKYAIVSDNMHLFPGSGVKTLTPSNHHLEIEFDTDCKVQSRVIWIQVPELQAISINKTLCFPEEREGRYWVKYCP